MTRADFRLAFPNPLRMKCADEIHGSSPCKNLNSACILLRLLPSAAHHSISDHLVLDSTVATYPRRAKHDRVYLASLR